MSSVASISAPTSSDLLVRILGRRAAVLHGDPCVADRWRWVRRRLAAGPCRTLDAGSGSGAFALAAERLGNDVTGISFDRERNATARRRAAIVGATRIRFVDGDLRNLPALVAASPKFDQALCLETLEHVPDDRALVADLAAALAPGGRLFLSTPYAGYRPLLGDRLDQDGTGGGHLRWGYTHAELRELLAAAGLEVVSEEFVSGVVSQQLTNLMRLLDNRVAHLGWAATLLLRPLRLLDRPLSQLLRYPYLCVAVEAVKPR